MVILPDIIEQTGRNKRNFSLPSKLFEHDIITLFGEIDEDMAYSIITQLLYLDTLDTHEPVKLYINSPGGSVTDGLAIIDVMNVMSRKVDTIGMGSCASMGSALLLSGTGIRRAVENTRIMLHSVSSGFAGNYHDHKIDFKETEYLQDKLMSMIAEKTGLPLPDVQKLTERDFFISVDKAISLGIIDSVVSRS